MKGVCALLLFFSASSAVQHSLKYLFTVSYGVPDFPQFVGSAMLDGVEIGYCDSNMKTSASSNHDWTIEFINDYPEHLDWYSDFCLGNQVIFMERTESIVKHLNQSGGVHVVQRVSGCEWDEETGETVGFNEYGYNGEDFMILDLETLTWKAQNPQALPIKAIWDTEEEKLGFMKDFYLFYCPLWISKFLNYDGGILRRTEHPSMSFLQKYPCSPVSCFATGFYPNRVEMFWRKDGERLYEGVDHGEILPNHDETYQMSVHLNISLVKPDDWSSYECVFQLAGMKEDIAVKLDPAQIISNKEQMMKFSGGEGIRQSRINATL